MSAPVAADRDPGSDEPTVLRAQIAALEAQLVALTQLPLLVLRIDRQHRAIYVSPTVEQLTARPAAAVLGEPIHALGLPADLVERWAATLTTVFATGQPAQISFAVPSAAGPRHYDARLIPETAPDGTVATVLVSAYDVTDRAATLHANAERLDLILRHLPITFFAQDADLRYTWITNPPLGFLTEEVLGKTDSELLPTASAASLAALKRTVLEQGVGMHTEVRITRAGDERLYDLTIEPIRDAAGAPCGVLCAALDITERQQLEAQLHHHQALLQSLVNHAPAIIAVKDLAGRFLLVNQQLATALGREPASLLNQTVDDLFPPAIAAAMRANDQQVLRTSQPLEVEESILIGGEQHTQLAVLFPIVDALGAPSALGLVATDITARKRAEEALRASEVRQAFLIQLNDTLRSLADPLAIQATACRLLGEYLGVNAVTYADIDGDEFILRPGYVQDVTPMLGRGPLAGFGATLLEAYRRGETIAVADTSTDERFTAEERAAFQVAQIAAFTGVVRIKAARWVGLFGTQSATPRTWTDAEVALIEAVAQRIWAAVEHARAEEALRESEARLAAFMEYAPGSVFIKDAAGRYVIVNHAFLTDSGKRADEVLGKTDAEIFSQDLVEMFVAEDQAVRMSGTPRAFEETFVYQGQQYTFLSHKFPLPGGSVGCFGADITARKAVDDALHELQARRLADEQQHVARVQQLYTQEQAARAQAEAASRLKDEFLATVSHELRTPLTAFLGYAQLLQRRMRDDDPSAPTVALMVQSAKAQAALIEDLLDVSRIVSGKLRLNPELITLTQVIHAALDTVRPTVEAKGLHLQVDLDPAASAVMGDANRLQQVVWNLLANATKFTPPGGCIAIRLAATASHAELSVVDSGQGIRAEFLPYVFEHFRQADSSSKRTHGGLGLGLAIVRHLVELHGGTVEARSDGVGQGATFTVRLPLASARDPSGQTLSPTSDDPTPEAGLLPLRGLRVLVVDDQPTIVRLLEAILAAEGATVWACTSAQEAFAQVRAWHPDVLVSDIAMPSEDGYWLIQQVRSLAPEAGGATPAVALTAYVRMEDRMRVLEAGFQEYMPKPVDAAELREVVLRLVATDLE